MKTLLLAITLCFTAVMAQAEVFKLFERGHWSVSYVTGNDGRPYCVASVSGEDVYFSIDVGLDRLDAWYINYQNDFGTGVEGDVRIWIDGHRGWVTPAYGQHDTVRMWGLKQEFLSQVMNGRKLWIDQDADGRWDAWFSLAGSKAAMFELGDCANKL